MFWIRSLPISMLRDHIPNILVRKGLGRTKHHSMLSRVQGSSERENMLITRDKLWSKV